MIAPLLEVRDMRFVLGLGLILLLTVPAVAQETPDMVCTVTGTPTAAALFPSKIIESGAVQSGRCA